MSVEREQLDCVFNLRGCCTLEKLFADANYLIVHGKLDKVNPYILALFNSLGRQFPLRAIGTTNENGSYFLCNAEVVDGKINCNTTIPREPVA